MPDEKVILHQFRSSHFNEKARWALDYKGVPHARKSYLPGPHLRVMKNLTGQTKTPVVQFGGEFVIGSARIIDALETRYPDPPLYPVDPVQRTRALEIQTWFDDDIGPRVRRPILNATLTDLGYFSRMFGEGQRPSMRLTYRAMLPLAKRLVLKGNGITSPDAVEDGVRAIQEAFEFVVREAGPEGYLVGDTFSAADLTAAALLAPAANPPDAEMTRPSPMPAPVADLLNRWADHPGRAWVLEMYHRHRGDVSTARELAA